LSSAPIPCRSLSLHPCELRTLYPYEDRLMGRGLTGGGRALTTFARCAVDALCLRCSFFEDGSGSWHIGQSFGCDGFSSEESIMIASGEDVSITGVEVMER
jgi:hypothetical protein